MPTVYRPQIDLLRIDANGFRVPLAATTVSVYNVTAAASLGTLVSDANGVIVEGSFTAAVGDIVQFSHATYPLTFRLTLAASQELAYTGEINAYIVQNLYSNSTSKQVDIYALDSTNTALPPKKIGTGKPGTTIQIPYQTTVDQTLNIFPVALDENLNIERTNFDTANFQPVTIPGAGSAAAEPYLISAFSADLDAALAAMTTGGRLKIDVDTTYAANLTTPANVIVTFPNDSTLNVTDATKTVTIGGKMEDPGNRQVFPGIGNVVFARNAVPHFRAEWWAGNGTSDDNHSFAQIVTSLTNNLGGMVLLGSGKWKVKDFDSPSYSIWSGVGNDVANTNATVIEISDVAAAGLHVLKFTTNNARHIVLSNLAVSSSTHATASCLYVDQTVGSTFSGLACYDVTFWSANTGGTIKQVYIKGTGHSEIVDVLFEHCMSVTPDGSRSYQCDSINTDITWVQPRFVHGVNAIGIYAESLGQAKMIRGNFSGINSGNNDNRGATGSHSFNGTTTSGVQDITVVSGTLSPSDIGQPIYLLGVVDSYITGLYDSGGVTHVTTLNVTTGNATNQVFTIYRMLPDTARAATPIYIAGSHGVLDFEYTEEGYQRSFDMATSVNDLLNPVNLNNCYLQSTVKMRSAIALNLNNCHAYSNFLEDVAGVTARVHMSGCTVDKTNVWGWELTKPQVWGDHPGGSYLHTEFNTQEAEYIHRISPSLWVHRWDLNNAADLNSRLIGSFSNALTSGTWPAQKRNHEPLVQWGRLNAYSGDPDHYYGAGRDGTTGHSIFVQSAATEAAGIGGYDFDAAITSTGAITAGGTLAGASLTLATLTPGAIAYPGTGGVFQQNVNDFVFSPSTLFFGLGQPVPGRKFDLSHTGAHFQFRIGDSYTNVANTYDIGRNYTTGFKHEYGNQTGFVGYVWGGIDGEYARLTASGWTFTNIAAKTTPIDADSFCLIDSAAANVVKKVTGTDTKAYLKTYFDTLYGPSDTAYNATSWDGVTTIAPSKNAVRDKFETLRIGADVQAYNANLTTYAGIAPSANVQTLLGAASYAAFRASLGVGYNLFDIVADDTTAGTTPETLATYTVAANTLANNGDKITGFYAGVSGANANEKEWALSFAGTQIGDALYAANVGAWNMKFSIIRVSSTTVRAAVTFLVVGSQYPRAIYTEISGLNLVSTGYTLLLQGTTSDLAGDITLKLGNGKFEPAA